MDGVDRGRRVWARMEGDDNSARNMEYASRPQEYASRPQEYASRPQVHAPQAPAHGSMLSQGMQEQIRVGIKERPPKLQDGYMEEQPAKAESPDVKHDLDLESTAASGSGLGQDGDSNAGPPKKRRKVGHACVYCRRSERPCKRCMQRSIGHLCHDEPRTPTEAKKCKAPPPRPIHIPGTPSTGVMPSPDVGSQPPDSSRRPSLQLAGHAHHQSQSQQMMSPMGPPFPFDAAAPVTGGSGGTAPVVGTRATTPTSANTTTSIGGGMPLVSPSTGAMVAGHNPNELRGFSNPSWLSSPQQMLQMHNYSTAFMFSPEVEATHELNLINDFLYNNGAGGPHNEAAARALGIPLLGAHSQNHNTTRQNLLTPYDRRPSVSGIEHLARNRIPPSNSSNISNSNSRSNNNGSNNNSSSNSSNSLHPQNTPIMMNQPNGNHKTLAASSMAQDKTQEYYLHAADPPDNQTPANQTPGERIMALLDTKYAAGLLNPFNYVNGYKRLGEYLDNSVSRASRHRVLQALKVFRPRFRELAQALTDRELVYVEMWFEGKLMEYDRVFASMAVPACCWRRTGEIYRANREMSELIDVSVDRWRDGKLALHEILTEESLVRYWEEFRTIAFDDNHDTLLSACELKHPDDKTKPTIKCAFSMMIRWDEHKIPTLIVGNFLPDDPAP